MLGIDDVNENFDLHNDVFLFSMEKCPACDEIKSILNTLSLDYVKLNFYEINFHINNVKFKALTSLLGVNFYPSVVLVKNKLPVFLFEAFYSEAAALENGNRVLTISYKKLNDKKWTIVGRNKVENYIKTIFNDFNIGDAHG
jgi:thiol-disulfide isomerase/thioredoxin